MLTKRIIPCLDVFGGRVVKGRQFRDLVDVGDPVDLARRYSDEGADEIVLLDISATLEGRAPFTGIVEKTAASVSIPLTAGGGIRNLDDILGLLRSGADKVSLNTVIAEDPGILSRAAERVGRQALVAAVDVRRLPGEADRWSVCVRSGTIETRLDALDYARTVAERGAGELLVTSIDRDGMKNGYDVDLLAAIASAVKVPVVASGGAGSKEHLRDALKEGKADAVLAASLFHFNELSIPGLKQYLEEEGIPVRR